VDGGVAILLSSIAAAMPLQHHHHHYNKYCNDTSTAMTLMLALKTVAAFYPY
jgi:hypothetical protein